MLAGNNETIDAWHNSKDKVIKKLWLDEEANKFIFVFTDDSKLTLFDNGQSCCESRYMRTDGNDLQPHVGHKLVDINITGYNNTSDKYAGGEHEEQFVRVTTSLGTFVLVNHNEHNGYYGGFSLELIYTPPAG